MSVTVQERTQAHMLSFEKLLASLRSEGLNLDVPWGLPISQLREAKTLEMKWAVANAWLNKIRRDTESSDTLRQTQGLAKLKRRVSAWRVLEGV
ncbi:MAG: hypothetical protein ACRDHE_13950 [Ktedonobacterales bacterium]